MFSGFFRPPPPQKKKVLLKMKDQILQIFSEIFFIFIELFCVDEISSVLGQYSSLSTVYRWCTEISTIT